VFFLIKKDLGALGIKRLFSGSKYKKEGTLNSILVISSKMELEHANSNGDIVLTTNINPLKQFF